MADFETDEKGKKVIRGGGYLRGGKALKLKFTNPGRGCWSVPGASKPKPVEKKEGHGSTGRKQNTYESRMRTKK